MDKLQALAIIAAGIGAGAINTMVGSGSLVSFPVLLAFGYSPVSANIANTIGLVPGSISGVVGYRHELSGQRHRILALGVTSLIGAVIGAALLLLLPASVFTAVIPVIIGLAVVLVLLQPRLAAANERRSRLDAPARAGMDGRTDRPSAPPGGPPSAAVRAAVAATGVYGGYFSAAQGILLLAVLGLGLRDSLQRINALKNVLQLVVNVVAALVFVLVADVEWSVCALLATGSLLGGKLGSVIGRALSPLLLRSFVAVVGVAAIYVLAFT